MPIRGVYWNLAYTDTFENNGQIKDSQTDFLNRLKIGRVHLWLNDQPNPPPPYSRDFAYTADWSRAKVLTAIDALQESGIAVVLTLSPWFQTREYLEGLSEPLSIAVMRSNVDIEFDLEGIFATEVLQATDPILSKQDAHQVLLDVASQAARGVPIGLSTTRFHLQAHSQIVAKAAWIAPQSYDAGDVEADYKAINALRAGVEIRFAINCESFGEHSVPLATFQANLTDAIAQQHAHVTQVTGHAIWSRFALQQGPFPNEGVQVNGQPYADVLAETPVG